MHGSFDRQARPEPQSEPNVWAQKAVELYRQWRADRIVAEANNGGDLVENTIRMFDENVAFSVVHATRGKVKRAEPVAALYEACPGHPLGRIFHVGTFPELEDQMCELTIDFDPKVAGYSPDRADALVWSFTELMVERMDGWGYFERTVGSQLRSRPSGSSRSDDQRLVSALYPMRAFRRR